MFINKIHNLLILTVSISLQSKITNNNLLIEVKQNISAFSYKHINSANSSNIFFFFKKLKFKLIIIDVYKC